jgi:hypothetical protein
VILLRFLTDTGTGLESACPVSGHPREKRAPGITRGHGIKVPGAPARTGALEPPGSLARISLRRVTQMDGLQRLGFVVTWPRWLAAQHGRVARDSGGAGGERRKGDPGTARRRAKGVMAAREHGDVFGMASQPGLVFSGAPCGSWSRSSRRPSVLPTSSRAARDGSDGARIRAILKSGRSRCRDSGVALAASAPSGTGPLEEGVEHRSPGPSRPSRKAWDRRQPC